MIYLYDISHGDKKEINIFQICSIEEKVGDEAVYVHMANGDVHKVDKKRGEFMVQQINRIGEKFANP